MLGKIWCPLYGTSNSGALSREVYDGDDSGVAIMHTSRAVTALATCTTALPKYQYTIETANKQTGEV